MRTWFFVLCVLGAVWVVGCVDSSKDEHSRDTGIIARYAPNIPNQPGECDSRININDVIPRERQMILVDLADRLEKRPGIQAYLIAGSKLEEDGSRVVITIRNFASAKVYDKGAMYSLPPYRHAFLEVGFQGLEDIHNIFLEKGIPGGYQPDVFYQLNWDIDLYGRDIIISLGKQIQASQHGFTHN